MSAQEGAEPLTGQAVERAFVVEPFIDAWTEGEQRAEVFTPAAPVSVASVIAADKATVESRSQGRDYYAWFAGSARSRWPVYIAAIEAVTALEERFAEIGHNGHDPWEGEPECPGCVAADIRRALAVLAPSTDKEQQ